MMCGKRKDKEKKWFERGHADLLPRLDTLSGCFAPLKLLLFRGWNCLFDSFASEPVLVCYCVIIVEAVLHWKTSVWIWKWLSVQSYGVKTKQKTLHVQTQLQDSWWINFVKGTAAQIRSNQSQLARLWHEWTDWRSQPSDSLSYQVDKVWCSAVTLSAKKQVSANNGAKTHTHLTQWSMFCCTIMFVVIELKRNIYRGSTAAISAKQILNRREHELCHVCNVSIAMLMMSLLKCAPWDVNLLDHCRCVPFRFLSSDTTEVKQTKQKNTRAQEMDTIRGCVGLRCHVGHFKTSTLGVFFGTVKTFLFN